MSLADIDPRDYVSGGYYVSVDAGAVDCTGIRLRSTTMAHDHTQRRFLPDGWAFRWATTPCEPVEEAAHFGIGAGELDAVLDWTDGKLGVELEVWSTCFRLEVARWARRQFVRNPEVQIWGLGLHTSLVDELVRLLEPPPPPPGYAPMRREGVQVALLRREPIEPGGVPLGFEVLDFTHGPNSLESLHLAEAEILAEGGAALTPRGLCASMDAALRACAIADELGSERWFPWLLSEYPP